MTSALDEATRLRMICDTVRHCQRLRAGGAPATVYSRALREPIHQLWETADKSKDASAQFRSKASAGLRRGGGELVYDHAIPFNITQAQLLALDLVEPEIVRPILERGRTVALIAKFEDSLLNRLGLQSRMPDGWDGVDPLARYKAAQIELIPNVQVPRSRTPVSRPRTAPMRVVASPKEHEKFSSSESSVKVTCNALCDLLEANGYSFDTGWRRDGFSFASHYSPTVKIDPKANCLRVNAGKDLPIQPPSCMIHGGGQPEWLVVRPADKAIALAYFADLMEAWKARAST